MKTGKCSSVVEARVLRFWEARNVKRDGELSLSVLSLHILERERKATNDGSDIWADDSLRL
ncbi:hypothetical protein IGI04_036266 [Brassica rapa subsp. trilocularis]|uniref:Uncharacterized protein n=1 Tax=Brassica rapa subsp. trilocularis TaxID=1813537 RepID=A0ABQ7LDZ5_BRACM|nr:hypothetical protein IGI04_036266 [Brassica rapa subsp. trilocularis]